MAKVLESRLSPEGRVVIPADIRHQLGLRAGDRVQFVLDDDGDVHLTTPQSLAEAVWAHNTSAVEDTDEGDRQESRTEADRVARWFEGSPDDTPPMPGDELLARLFLAQ